MLLFTASGHRGVRVGARQSAVSGGARARRHRRRVRRALGCAGVGVRVRGGDARLRVGRDAERRRPRAPALPTRRRQTVLARPLRDLDRRRRRRGVARRALPSDAGALVVVDAVSSLGAVPLETDAWGIDVVVSGSQKALMAPPGLALVTVSRRAWERCERAALPRFYFDWRRYRRALENLSTPFTPAVSTVAALDVALGLLLEEGLEASVHPACGARPRVPGGSEGDGPRALLAGRGALGRRHRDPDPEEADARELVLALRQRFGITVAGGHGELGVAPLPHRPHRLVRRLRHHDRAGRRRARARGHGGADRARRGRDACARGVRRSTSRREGARPRADRGGGRGAPASRFRSRRRRRLRPGREDRRLRRDRHPLRDEADRRADRARLRG